MHEGKMLTHRLHFLYDPSIHKTTKLEYQFLSFLNSCKIVSLFCPSLSSYNVSVLIDISPSGYHFYCIPTLHTLLFLSLHPSFAFCNHASSKKHLDTNLLCWIHSGDVIAFYIILSDNILFSPGNVQDYETWGQKLFVSLKMYLLLQIN